MRKHILIVLLCFALLASAAPAMHAQTTLQVGIADETLIPLWSALFVPQFEALYPGIKVELQYVSWTVDNLIVRYIGGNPPDVIQLGGDKLGAYLDMLQPLDRYVAEWDDFSDFLPSMVDSARHNGMLYGLPWNFSTRTLTYRADWFEEAGLNSDRPPTTWAELVEIGRKLIRVDASDALTRQGFGMTSNFTNFSSFLFQAGGDWMTEDMTQARFADDAGMEATRFVASLFHEHRISSRELGGLPEGATAMELASPGAFYPDHSPHFEPHDIGVGLPLRHHEQWQIVMPSLWSIIDISPHHDAAWKWIEFNLNLENVIMTGQYGALPVRMSAVSHPPWSDDPRWRTTMEAVSLGKTVTQASPHWDLMRRDYQQPALSRILYEGESPTIMEEAQRQANVWLAAQLSGD